MINLAVVFGGKSVEHDISIITYTQVINSLDQKKYRIIPLYFSKNNDIYTSKSFLCSDFFRDDFNERLYNKCYLIKGKEKSYVKRGFHKIRIDVALIVMHGKDLEDGTISGFFKVLNIPTTNCSVGVSAVLHDKFYTKLLMKELDINVLDYKVVSKKDLPVSIDGRKMVKACRLGSSIGIKKANGKDEINKAIYDCLKYDDKVIVEDLLSEFRELNQALYIKNGKVILSDIEEIIVKNNMFTFADKYQNRLCERVVPAQIDEEINAQIVNSSLKIGENLQVRGVIRIDYLYNVEEKKVYVNEINVIPGALAYYLFESKGIYFKQFLDDLINEGIRNAYFENEKIQTFSSSVLSSQYSLKK